MVEQVLKCFGLPDHYKIFSALFLLLLVFPVYVGIVWFFRTVFRRTHRLDRKLVEALRLPLFVVLLEIALAISVNVLGLKEKYEASLHHALVIIIIATVGWIFGVILHTLFRHFKSKVELRKSVSAQRSMLTQIHFLYRLMMLVIVLVTLAAILMTFPYIKTVGIGILGSAGIAGIAIGIAARPVLQNVIAGLQIAFTKMLKLGDVVIVEGNFSKIEALHLTHVIARTWDLKKIILPVSYFVEKPFETWDASGNALLGTVEFYCDYTVSTERIRDQLKGFLEESALWDGNVWNVQVTNFTEKTMEVRLLMSADAENIFSLRCFVREKLVEFLQSEYPESYPFMRIRECR